MSTISRWPYSRSFTQNGETYIVVLQNRVNPKTLIKLSCDKTGLPEYWISPSNKDIRLYGICIMKIS